MAKKYKQGLKSRKKLLAIGIGIIIFVLLFSVIGVVALYLGGGQNEQNILTDSYSIEGQTINIPNDTQEPNIEIDLGVDGDIEIEQVDIDGNTE